MFTRFSRLKTKKLNQRGFGHHIILPVLVVAAVAAIGTYVLVKSHAASVAEGTLQGEAMTVTQGSGQKISDTNANGKQALKLTPATGASSGAATGKIQVANDGDKFVLKARTDCTAGISVHVTLVGQSQPVIADTVVGNLYDRYVQRNTSVKGNNTTYTVELNYTRPAGCTGSLYVDFVSVRLVDNSGQLPTVPYQYCDPNNSNNCNKDSLPQNLKFDDEFDSKGLDTSKWQPNWLGSSNSAVTNPPNGNMLDCEDPANVSQPGDGFAYLKLEQRSCNGHSYASGYLSTYNSYHPQYGYFEAKMYIPGSASNCYNWPGFWTDGMNINGIKWPVFLEDDVMECLGGDGHTATGTGGNPGATIHAGPSADNDAWKHTIGHITDLSGETKSGWHIYATNIQPGPQSLNCSGSTPDPMTTTTYYDGRRLGTYNVCAKNTGQFMSLQNDIGLWGGEGHTPSTVQIDYVRSWQ